MDVPDEMNEKLREVSCIGDTDAVCNLLQNGADVNSQNKMNGWTCLHWAAKRGHISLINLLLNSNANPNIQNFNGENAVDVSCSEQVKLLFDKKRNNDIANEDNKEHIFKPIVIEKEKNNNEEKFVPNYLSHPFFPYSNEKNINRNSCNNESEMQDIVAKNATTSTSNCYVDDVKELVLKVRNANSEEQDFIEIELDIGKLSFENFLNICCTELNIDKREVKKVRKLPNTILRKDKDVQRLKQYQELEIFLY